MSATVSPSTTTGCTAPSAQTHTRWPAPHRVGPENVLGRVTCGRSQPPSPRAHCRQCAVPIGGRDAVRGRAVGKELVAAGDGCAVPRPDFASDCRHSHQHVRALRKRVGGARTRCVAGGDHAVVAGSEIRQRAEARGAVRDGGDEAAVHHLDVGERATATRRELEAHAVVVCGRRCRASQ
jgi:hypothetical protein